MNEPIISSPYYVSEPSIGGACPTHYRPLGTCCNATARYGSEPSAAPSTASQAHPSDLVRARDELRRRAKEARHAASEEGVHGAPRAAALRGKAKGYEEGADLIESILRGGRLRRKWRRPS